MKENIIKDKNLENINAGVNSLFSQHKNFSGLNLAGLNKSSLTRDYKGGLGDALEKAKK